MMFLIGFRKWILVVVFFLVSLGLLWKGILDGKSWLEVNRDVLVAFIGSNIGEHMINFGKLWLESKGRADIKDILKSIQGEKQ